MYTQYTKSDVKIPLHQKSRMGKVTKSSEISGKIKSNKRDVCCNAQYAVLIVNLPCALK